MVYPLLSNPLIAIYPHEYGAKFDNATNDLSALNASLDLLSTTYGGTLILPCGKAKLGSTWNLDISGQENVPMKILGQGAKSSVFGWTGGNLTSTDAIIRANASISPGVPVANPVNKKSHIVMEDFGIDSDNKDYAGRHIHMFGTNVYDIRRVRMDGAGSAGNAPSATQTGIRSGLLDGIHSIIENCASINIGVGYEISSDWVVLNNIEADQTLTYGYLIKFDPYYPVGIMIQGFKSGGHTVYCDSSDGGDLATRIPVLIATSDEEDAQYGTKTESIYNNKSDGTRMFILGMEQRSITTPPAMFGGAGKNRIVYIPLYGFSGSLDALQRDTVLNVSAIANALDAWLANTATMNLRGTGVEDFFPDGDGYAIRYTTPTGSANTFSGREFGSASAPITRREWNPTLNGKFKHASASLLQSRGFIGFANTSLQNMLTVLPPTGEYFGLYWATDDSTYPSKYIWISNDGGGIDRLSTGVSLDNNFYEFNLQMAGEGTNLATAELWTKIGWLKKDFVKNKSALPGASTNLMLQAGIVTTNTAQKVLHVYKLKARHT